MIKIKNKYLNRAHISIVYLNREELTLVVDMAYSKPEGPVFLTFPFDTEEEAELALESLVG